MKFLRLSGNVYRDRKAKRARNRTRHSSTLFQVPLMTFAPSGRFRNLLGRETLNQLARHPFRISQKHLEVFETSSTGTNFKGPWRQTSKQMEKVELRNCSESTSKIPLRKFRRGLDVSREAKLLEDKSLAFVPRCLNPKMIELRDD